MVTRATGNLAAVLDELEEWFHANLTEQGGCIPASAALPALWLSGLSICAANPAINRLRRSGAPVSSVL